MKSRGGLFLMCVLVAGASVQATSISGPFVTSTPIPSTKTDWSGASLAFPKFNSALGVLQSIELKINAALDTVLTVTNNATSASNGWAKTEVQLSVQNAGNDLMEPVLDMLTAQYNFSLNPGGVVTSGTIHKVGNSDDIYTTPAILAAFTGLGNITLSAETLTYAVISYTGGNTDASQSTYASATGTVTYTYEIPEPATLSLLSLGMIGLLRRRRA